MWSFLSNLLESSSFMPHGHCYLWQPGVLWLNVGSDGLIVLAYFSIPLALVRFVQQRSDVAFAWMFVLFGAFILACGASHLSAIWTVWYPTYRLEGGIKAVTAVVSVLTAILLWRLLPEAVRLPSPAQLASEVEERRAAERRLTQLNQELEARVAERTAALQRSNQELSQFATVASHDLREPLRAVQSFAELLEEECLTQVNARGREYLGHVLRGAERMSSMVDALLDYARLGHDAVQVDVDSERELDEALRLLDSTLQQAGAQLHRGQLPRVQFPAGMLRQVFANLLANCLKYRSDRPLEIRVEAHAEGEHVHFQVRDNGIGIEPRFLEEIFEPFRRLHTSDERPGNGIGLATCRKLVMRAGGKMWATSLPGEGSVLHFVLLRATSAMPRGTASC